MGKVKNKVEKAKFREFRNKLVGIGFSEGFCDEEELICGIIFRERGEELTVHVDFGKRTVKLYNETAYGDFKWSRYEYIQPENLTDFDKFVDWLDKIVG